VRQASVAFFALGGLVGAAVELAFAASGTRLIGASAGVATLAGALAVFAPRDEAVLPGRDHGVPCWLALPLGVAPLAVVDFAAGPHVDWRAHLAGFGAGAAVALGTRLGRAVRAAITAAA
jgi:membrane associated rhomboid family serine protease